MAQQNTPAPAAAKPQPPVPPAEFHEGAIEKMSAADLIAILKSSSSSEFQKSKACVRLGELGAKEAVPVLASFLSSEHLNVYARYGLEPIADPSVDDALRAALLKLKGNLLIGVINSINKRRDAKAGPALIRLMSDSDADVVRAAIAALGSIGGDENVKALKAALTKTNGLTRLAVADAVLVSAERYLQKGKRTEALDLYAYLGSPEIPKSVRLAAMNSIIREETSVNRPR